MRAHRGFSPLVLLLLLTAVAPQIQAEQQVALGNAMAPLTGPWKFHIGDDMAWAQPGFDDSGWGTMDLTPPSQSYDPALGSSGYVPGWTARGFKGAAGYAWYRLRVIIQDGQPALALKMPDNFDDAYQVYVNGQRIGEFGRFTENGVKAYPAVPRAFPLPAHPRAGPMTLAIRVWMAPFTALIDPDAGGLHGPPVLGHAAIIGGLLQLDWNAIDRSFYTSFLEVAILLLALLVAFALFWLDRTEPAYMWLGLTCAAILARVVLILVANYVNLISDGPLYFFQDTLLYSAIIGLWVLFWANWFRLSPMGRLLRIIGTLVVLLGLGTAMLHAPLYGWLVPVHAIVWLSPVTLLVKLLLGLLLVWVTVRGIDTDKTEGWLALPAVVLVVLSLYQVELSVLHVRLTFFPFGMGIGLGQIATILSLLMITLLMLRRFLHAQREREQWKLEIEQARQVQQMLIPEALPQIPGLTIESEYSPAQQVGGDFFQIIPDAAVDGVLIVVGDVTGHGLQAGMLVALIIGALRNETARTCDPLTVLNALNRTLCERGHAHATCMALRITSDGAVTLANAGHMPPYRNGKELLIEGSLPLGMVQDSEFPVMHFRLSPGDGLMLLSDGVAEAQDAQGHLFGFERIEALLQGPVTAAEVAATARNFGQEDDISVLAVTRNLGSQVTLS